MSSNLDALWRRYQETGDPDARSEILEQHLGLVHHAVRGVAARVGDAVEYDDLLGAGMLGLVQAIEAFDPDRGFAFPTYAMQRVRGSVLDSLRAADHRPRLARERLRRIDTATAELQRRLDRPPVASEIAAELEVDLDTFHQWRSNADRAVAVSFDAPVGSESNAEHPSLAETLSDDRIAAPDSSLEAEDRTRMLAAAIAELPEQQRMVLTLYFYEELNLRQIAEVLHVTESRISQVRTAALKTLRSQLTLELAP